MKRVDGGFSREERTTGLDVISFLIQVSLVVFILDIRELGIAHKDCLYSFKMSFCNPVRRAITVVDHQGLHLPFKMSAFLGPLSPQAF